MGPWSRWSPVQIGPPGNVLRIRSYCSPQGSLDSPAPLKPPWALKLEFRFPSGSPSMWIVIAVQLQIVLNLRQLLYGPTIEARWMTQHLAQFAHKCILEHSLHLLEHWFEQKPGRTHANRTVITRREVIYFRWDHLLQSGLSRDHLLHMFTLWCTYLWKLILENKPTLFFL